MIFDFNNDSNSCNTTIVYNFTTKKSNYNKSLINQRNFNKNKNNRSTTLKDHINFIKIFKINTNNQNHQNHQNHPIHNNFINNHIHKWKNKKIL